MKNIARNLSTPENREFWAFVDWKAKQAERINQFMEEIYREQFVYVDEVPQAGGEQDDEGTTP